MEEIGLGICLSTLGSIAFYLTMTSRVPVYDLPSHQDDSTVQRATIEAALRRKKFKRLREAPFWNWVSRMLKHQDGGPPCRHAYPPTVAETTLGDTDENYDLWKDCFEYCKVECLHCARKRKDPTYKEWWRTFWRAMSKVDEDLLKLSDEELSEEIDKLRNENRADESPSM